MKSKILLLGINARFVHSTLSLYYLKQILYSYSYDPVILETTINNPVEETLERIKTLNPHVCCIAVYIWNALYIKKLLPLIHTILPHCAIVLGGPEVSYTSEIWFREFPYINIIVQGPGEKSFEYIAQNHFEITANTVALNNYHFDDIPFPYSSDDLVHLAHHFIYYESSRGCPYACTYCISSREDQRLQFKDINKVYEELSFLLQHNVRMVKFVDRTFNCNPSHSRAILTYLIENNNNHTQFHFEIHPDLLTDTDFELLQHVPPHYFQFEIGIQSIHSTTLHAINRKMNWEKSREHIKRLMDLGTIHIHLDMICGLPYEDMAAIATSFNEIIRLKPHYFQMGFLKVLPGTAQEKNKHEFGLTHETTPPYTVIKTNWLSEEDMQTLHTIERVTDSLYNHHFKVTTNMLDYFIAKGNLFDVFKIIAHFAKKEGFTFYTKGFEQIASMLLSFIKSEHPEFLDLATDCIRWDWFIKSNSKWIPPAIRSKTNPNTVKEMIINTHRISKDQISIMDKVLPLQTIKRAQIFIAESSHFRQWNMHNQHYALKLPDGTILYTD